MEAHRGSAKKRRKKLSSATGPCRGGAAGRSSSSRQRTMDEFLAPLRRSPRGAGRGPLRRGGREATGRPEGRRGGGPLGGGAASPSAAATKQVARKRTSQPPPPRPRRSPQPSSRPTTTIATAAAAEEQQQTEDVAGSLTTATGGISSLPGPSTGGTGSGGPSPAAGGAQQSTSGPEDVIELRVRRGRPHPDIEYQYNMVELGRILDKGAQETVEFAQRHGLLMPERPCNTCMAACNLDYREREKGQPCWVCRRHAPSFSQSITKNTVFDGSHVRMDKLLILFYMFGHGMTEYRHLQREISSRSPPPEQQQDEEEGQAAGEQRGGLRGEAGRRAAANRSRAQWIQTSSATIRQWLLFCREICFVFLDTKFDEEGRIGGVGVVVEIDESKIGKMKHHVGRRVEGQWILGMIEINTGEEGQKRRRGRFRLELCPDNRRDEATLRQLIQKHILPGTTLVTDGWKGYCNISYYDYEQYTVIHEYNFVDPTTGANTQTIESNWRAVKRMLLRGGLKREELALHLCEFLWRRLVHGLERDPFVEFMSAAALVYDPATVLAEAAT